MNVEENRLKTFEEWPVNAAVDAPRIAKAGFYYTGHSLEVQCFLCGTTVSDWNYGDQAMARHRQAQPACPFVVNSADTCNVPLIPASASVSIESSVTSSLPVTRQSNVIKGNLGEVQETAVRSTNPLRDYGTTSQRLRSFVNWPISSVVSPEQLAKSGFYYLQFSDLVECIYCGGVLTKWEAGDDPDSEHRLHFPNCDFYMRYETEDEALELANVTLVSGATTGITELGIQVHTAPSNPKNTTYEERLRTFVGWPTDHKQTPEMLSAAGFYYTGTQDQVRCFHCDGGLRNWEPKDDVWSEHARWFPTCTFVNLVRGQEFVKHCIDSRPPLDPKSALEIGLSVDRVKRTLKRKMEECGVTYTNAEELIQDVLHDQTMEDYNSGASDSSFSELVVSTDRIVVQTTHNSTNTFNDDEKRNICSEMNNLDDKEKDCEVKGQENSGSKTEVFEDKEQKTDAVNKEDELEGKKNIKSNNITLQEENRRLKEARLCKICMDNDVAIVFLPCGHLATCIFCAPSLTFCPMCRIMIRASVRTFLS
ncbi:Apoptosis 2 inhibitor [Harpegnathos saltator]|uniref:Apoptosis 2 inhibitor n=1 Tax=Harpegnathos saltator TaxID=610380 RepID=E2BF81_HARSA|nr:Apoptosis 2 inhibitor [Harpegnathos saltator]